MTGVSKEVREILEISPVRPVRYSHVSGQRELVEGLGRV